MADTIDMRLVTGQTAIPLNTSSEKTVLADVDDEKTDKKDAKDTEEDKEDHGGYMVSIASRHNGYMRLTSHDRESFHMPRRPNMSSLAYLSSRPLHLGRALPSKT